MKFIKDNWFKISIIIIMFGFLVVYTYDVYNKYQPKTLQEKIQQEILK